METPPDPALGFGRHFGEGVAPRLDDLEAALSDEVIVAAVAAPPPSWPLADEERVALAEFLARRRDLVLAPLRSAARHPGLPLPSVLSPAEARAEALRCVDASERFSAASARAAGRKW